MEATYKVTDSILFSEKVADLDIESLGGGELNISIEFTNGCIREIQGEFSPVDFEEEYGFVLVF